jgi:NAD(P)-dependent dehydrogenase (short-subunit alcohol dehydrogenase family)
MSGWTAQQIPDQTGRMVVVTGANSGIGFHAARELAAHGATVILAVRDVAKGEAAARKVGGAVEVRQVDLADLESVRRFCEAWDGPLDLLVNNAGIMTNARRETAQGFESQFGTNHLGHFALTGGLLRHLLSAEAPRVVTISSGAHRMGKLDFEDLQGERSFKGMRAYGTSKLANLLFCFELQRRSDAAGAGLTSVAAHPGYSGTNLFQTGNPLLKLPIALANRTVAQSPESGALPTLFAATQDLAGASYVGPDGPGEMRGAPHLVGVSPAAQDPQVAAKLWDVSEVLTGVHYDFTAVPV